MRSFVPLFVLAVASMGLSNLGCSQEQTPSKIPPTGLAGTIPSTSPAPPATPSSPPPAMELPPSHPPVSGAPTGPPPATAEKGALPLGHPPLAKMPANDTIVEGEVLEKKDAASYTYIKLKLATGQEAWAAVLQAPVRVGAQVKIAQQMVMENFQAKSMNRTFDRIIFGTLIPNP